MFGDGPFAGTARFYRRRAPYAPQALAWLVERFALGPRSRVLDLGCGPARLAIPLARAAGEVVAVDPDPDMLAAGRRAARRRGMRNIGFVHARAEEAAGALGRFDLVVMGQSFHWMDRDLVLAALAQTIAPEGGLALVNPAHGAEESWEPVAKAIVARALGPPQRHPAANPEAANRPALERSPRFRRFETVSFEHRFSRTVRSAVDCVFSLSWAARPLYGERAEAVEAELLEALAALAPKGRFRERMVTDVVVAGAPPQAPAAAAFL